MWNDGTCTRKKAGPTAGDLVPGRVEKKTVQEPNFNLQLTSDIVKTSELTGRALKIQFL